MIFVSVGTHTQGFPRLIQKMDEIAGQIDEEVLMQIGASSYEPRHARYFRFDSQEVMEELNRQARVIVTHAGAGSILTALASGKPVIVVPRLARYGEVIDDHQLQITEVLSQSGKVIGVSAVEEIETALGRLQNGSNGSSPGRDYRLVQALREHVARLAASRG